MADREVGHRFFLFGVKRNEIDLLFTRLFVPLPSKWRSYSVSTKKETLFFVLCSTIRNFANEKTNCY
jgi:hypothetical protein